MKILFYLPLLTNSGGVERALSNLVHALCVEDVDVMILTNYGPIERRTFDFSAAKVIDMNIKSYRTNYPSILSNIIKVVKQERPDFFINVEIASLLFSLPLLLKRVRHETKLCVWEHFNFRNNNGRKIRNLLRMLSSRFCDGIVTLTRRDMDTWRANLTIRGKITAIPNISSFSKKEDNTYNIDSKLIISVGRLTRVKGYDRLLKSWKLFLSRHKSNGWRLNIIGNGELYKDLSNYIEANKLNESVEIISHTGNIESYYKKASFICLTSHNEGLPMVLLEAQSFGLPIIAFDCYTGPSEIVSKHSGIIVEQDNVNDFAKAIEYLMLNPEERKSMSVNALMEASRYDKRIVAKEWIYYLRSLNE